MEKINKLKNQFKTYNLDGYLVPKNDEFFSEYVPHDKDNLKYISKFSGSYGLALILKKNNYLFVDGRYTVQAKYQSGKRFKIISFPLAKSKLKLKKKKIGFDPKLFNESFINQFSQKLGLKCIPIKKNLVEKFKIIKRKYKKNNFFYFLDKSVTGESSLKKVKKIKKELINKNIDIMFITSSENIAWLLNIRGNDSDFAPIPNCFLIISKMKIYLFCDLRKINLRFRNKLNFINILGVDSLEGFIKGIKNKKFLIDGSTCSFLYKKIIEKNNSIKRDMDPIYFLKSQKNKTEINNTKKIHEYDGAALTKFLFWVQKNYKRRKITELTAQKKLLSFRKQFKQFICPSFPTISSTKENGAIVHYNASKKTDKVLKTGNIYLVDSGGQYHFGTTDVTRTISLDNQNNEIKTVFTKVLQGHLNLSNYKLTKKTTGSTLDEIARRKLKKMYLNYAHGTGHGVGYFLNVHEGPQSISKFNKVKLKLGMILSNEPGYYKEGKYGLRIENLIYIKKSKNGMKFDNLTFVPIDKNLIIKELLSIKEKQWLNQYHQNVYKKIKKYMNKKELILLKKSCSNI